MRKSDLRNIMLRAWEMYRTTGKAFAVCLSPFLGYFPPYTANAIQCSTILL